MKKQPKNSPKKPKVSPQKDPITLRERLKIASKGDDFLDFGTLLGWLKHSKAWESWGYKSFRECVAGENLGDWKRAYLLIKIRAFVRDYRISLKVAKQLGIYKLRILAKFAESDKDDKQVVEKNISRLVKEAQKRPLDDFRRYVAAKSGGGQPTIRLETKIPGDLRDLIGEHIEEMMKRDDIPYESVALRRICEEWWESQRGLEVDTKTLLGV